MADRKLHGRRRQQGSGIRQVHRPAVEDAAAVRTGDQRTAETAARARLDDGGRDGRVAHARRLSRVHPAFEGGVRRRQAHLRRDPIGMVQRSHRVLPGIGTPGAGPGHGLDRITAPRRRAAGVLVARRGARRHRRHQQRLRGARPARARNCPRSFRFAPDPSVVCSTYAAAEDCARRAGRHEHPAAEIGLGADDDVAADRGAGRERPRRHPVCDRRFDRRRQRCTRSIRTATGTTRRCGRGRSTRC